MKRFILTLPAGKQVFCGIILTTLIIVTISGCAMLFMPKSPEQAFHYYQAGVELLRNGDTEAALQNLRQAVQLDSLKPEYFWRLGQAYMGWQWLSYVDVKDHFLSDSGISAKFIYQVRSKEFLNDAVANMKKAAQLQPQAKYLLEIGEMLNSTGDDASALDIFRQTVEQFPQAEDARFKIASVYYFRQQYDSVLAYYREELKVNMEAVNKAPHMIASAFENLKNLDSAQVYFSKAVTLFPESRIPYENLGGFYERYKRYDEAIDTYRAMASQKIDTLSTLIALNKVGDVFVQKALDEAKGRYEKNFVVQAIENYKEVLSIDRFNREARRKLDIVSRIERDVKGLQEKTGAMYARGEMFFALRQYEDAIRVYQYAIEASPKHVPTYLRLGDAYYFNNQFDKAVEEYQKATDIEPDNVNTWGYLAYIYYESKDYGKAVQAAKRALELKPDYRQAQEIINRIKEEIKLEIYENR